MKIESIANMVNSFRNPPLLEDCLPPFNFSTRPRRLEAVPSRLISYVGLSQILVV